MGGAEREASAAAVWSGDLDQIKGGSNISAAYIRTDSQFDGFHSVKVDLVVFNLAGILWGIEIILLSHDFPGSGSFSPDQARENSCVRFCRSSWKTSRIRLIRWG